MATTDYWYYFLPSPQRDEITNPLEIQIKKPKRRATHDLGAVVFFQDRSAGSVDGSIQVLAALRTGSARYNACYHSYRRCRKSDESAPAPLAFLPRLAASHPLTCVYKLSCRRDLGFLDMAFHGKENDEITN